MKTLEQIMKNDENHASLAVCSRFFRIANIFLLHIFISFYRVVKALSNYIKTNLVVDKIQSL